MHEEALSLADAVRYHMSTERNPLEIAVVLLLSSRMTRSELQRFVSERLVPHARFRQTVAEAPFPRRPRWREEQAFDLDAHVVCHSEPVADDELLTCLAIRLSQRLPEARSPWQMELFPLAGERSALLFRVHHCVADGLSLVRLLCELADPPRPAAVGRTPSAPRRTRATPRRLLDKAWALSSTLLQLTAARPDARRDLHDLSGRKSLAWSRPIDLPALSASAEVHGHHVTELLLAATAHALARGLASAGGPVPPTVRALVPFGASLGKRELGNHFASTFVDLVLDESDPWRRIERVAEHTAKLHDSTQAGAARALIGLAGWLSPPLMRAALDFFSRRASLVLSNVPGPSDRVALLGHDVSSIVVFAPPSSRIGLSFTLFGYADELRLGVQVDEALELAPEQLVTDFEAAIGELSETRGRARAW